MTMTWLRLRVLYRRHTFGTKFWQWLARCLPNRLVYFAAIRVWSHATTAHPDYQRDLPDVITMHTAVTRWERLLKPKHR